MNIYKKRVNQTDNQVLSLLKRTFRSKTKPSQEHTNNVRETYGNIVSDSLALRVYKTLKVTKDMTVNDIMLIVTDKTRPNIMRALGMLIEAGIVIKK